MNFIQKLIINSDWFKNHVAKATQAAYQEGRNRLEEIQNIEKEIRRENFFHVGGLVIVVSNEWDGNNLIRGHIIGFMDSNIPHVRDMDTGKDFVCFGLTVPYHDDLFAALKKLNPFERYSLMTARSANSSSCYLFGKTKLEDSEA